ncbi:hypothetical protein [Burkholderia pseudomallei]|uniref:hypothetical protein n=1 Tax=Burkholderia pseudomallei TaxID=28450 RepID=UPI0012F4EC9B|nr:hypothetical protein [Burkholderia pseudomallei]
MKAIVVAIAALAVSASVPAKGGGAGGGHASGGHASAHVSAHAESAHATESAHPIAPMRTTSSPFPFWLFGHGSTTHCDDKANKDCKK